MPTVIPYVRGLLTTATAVLVVSLLLAFASFGSQLDSLRTFGLGFAILASGPVGGWVLAALDGELITALWGLLPLTFLTFGPLWFAIRRPSVRLACFAVTGIFWVLAGFLYGVAIWI